MLGNARDGADSQMISLPIDVIVQSGSAGTVLTPHGPIELKELKQIEAASNLLLLDLAAGWFPWWDRSPSALDLVRTAKTLMWVDVPWHVPAGENEIHLMSAAVKCCKLAKDADPAVDVPAREVRELEFFSQVERRNRRHHPQRVLGIGVDFVHAMSVQVGAAKFRAIGMSFKMSTIGD